MTQRENEGIIDNIQQWTSGHSNRHGSTYFLEQTILMMMEITSVVTWGGCWMTKKGHKDYFQVIQMFYLDSGVGYTHTHTHLWKLIEIQNLDMCFSLMEIMLNFGAGENYISRLTHMSTSFRTAGEVFVAVFGFNRLSLHKNKCHNYRVILWFSLKYKVSWHSFLLDKILGLNCSGSPTLTNCFPSDIVVNFSMHIRILLGGSNKQRLCISAKVPSNLMYTDFSLKIEQVVHYKKS